MLNGENIELCWQVLSKYGEENQRRKVIEECAELIQAINHKHRGRTHNISEEIADVEICLEQLKIINGCEDEVEAMREAKLERLYDRICNNCF